MKSTANTATEKQVPARDLYFQDLDEGLLFDFEEFVRQEVGIDSTRRRADTCQFFVRGHCPRGPRCGKRHDIDMQRRRNAVVCKHWLRALCKKGDQCEFLHEYNLRRMPECWFFTKYGECCNGEECLYLHVDPEKRRVECPWYARGFCKHGK
jgi:cleavage and polyadenylation specificity factor subunit 4